MRTFFRALVIVAITIACNVDRPYPPPSNPASASTLCRGCADGDVCHAAIGGGSCAPACTDDAQCEAIISGLVCHPALGQCAPSCAASIGGRTGDAICTAVSEASHCGEAGRCVPEARENPVTFRVFNASPWRLDVTTEGMAPEAADLAPGGLTQGVSVAPGARAFTFSNHADAGVLGQESFTLQEKKRYLAIVYVRAGEFAVALVEDTIETAPPSGEAWLRFSNFDAAAKDLRAEEAIATVVAQGQVRDPITTAAGARSFFVGDSPAQALTMQLDATLEAGEAYHLVTWANVGLALPETTLIGPSGVVARAQPAGVRFANLIFGLSKTLSVDGAQIFTGAEPFAVDPATGYIPLAPGSHVFLTSDGVPLDNVHPLAAGSHTTLLCYGGEALVVICTLLDDDPPMLAAEQRAQARAVHAAIYHQDATIDVTSVAGDGGGATLALALSYATGPSAFVAIGTSAPAITTSLNVALGMEQRSFAINPPVSNRAYTLIVFSAAMTGYDALLLDNAGLVTAF